MKKLIKAAALLLLVSAAATVSAEKTEAALLGDLNTAYQSGAYPAVVEYAVNLEKTYPRSLLLGKSYALKGESQYRLGRFQEAQDSLKTAVKLCEKNPELQIASWYWLGRTDAALKDDLTALQDLHAGAEVYAVNFTDYAPSSEKTDRYYNLIMLHSGKLFYSNEEYELSVPLLEYVIRNGLGYNQNEYNETLVQLFDAYNKCGKYSEAVSLFNSLQETSGEFFEDTVSRVLLSTGEALENLGRYREAYDKYCSVLTGTDGMMASIALQKCYTVASSHPREVGEEPGKILSDAESSLYEYGDLVAEFWTRLGIDAYRNKDFVKAASYFDNAETSEENPFTALIGLYRAEMAASMYRNSVKAASGAALEIINKYAEKTGIAEGNDYYNAYACSWTKWYGMDSQWQKGLEWGKKALQLNDENSISAVSWSETVYWYSLALYETGSYVTAASLLGKENLSAENCSTSLSVKALMLYARSLSKSGKNKEAMKVYASAAEKDLLTADDRVDYAKVLLASGYLTSAYRQALAEPTQEGYYVAALAAFNKKDWGNAEKYFTRYLSKPGESSAYASFYNGYSQYKQGELLSAYKTLSDFANRYPDHSLCWNARIVAANAAVQNNKYDNAASEAEKAIKCSSSDSERQNAITLCASIYTDAGDYDRAIEILKSSASENTDFGLRARYQTAQIYTRKGSLDSADRFYADIAQNFSSSSLADESAYRRGELYYTHGQYDAAIQRFNIYLDKFKKGLFTDASTFYLADSLARTEQTNRAIMQYLVLIQTDSESSYAYSAEKNLVALYRKQQNYSEALKTAQALLDKYGETARKDNVPEMIDEIKLLVSGVSEDEISLQQLYETSGGKASLDGRKAGTELAEMKWSRESTKNEAVGIAEEVYSVQKTKGAAESQWACRSAYIIAQYDRQQNYNSAAADVFLEAAGFGRQCGNDVLVQQCLYGACEAFNAAGKTADSKAVAQQLAKMYPDSAYAERALSLTGDN